VDHGVDPHMKRMEADLGKVKLAELEKEEGISNIGGGRFDLAGSVGGEGNNPFTKRAKKYLKWGLLYGDRVAVERVRGKSMDELRAAYKENTKHIKDPIVPEAGMQKEAVKDAYHATYQDMNAFTEIITGFKTKVNKWNFLGLKGFGAAEPGMRFAKVPGGLAHRIYEYTPLSAFETIGKAFRVINKIRSQQGLDKFRIFKKNKGTTDVKKLNEAQIFDAMVAQRDIVKKLTRTVSGTVLTAIGYGLYDSGVITPGRDENDKKASVLQALGIRPNSAWGTYALDVFQPVVDSILTGVNLAHGIKMNKYKEKTSEIGALLAKLSIVLHPLETYVDEVSGSLANQGVFRGIKTLMQKEGFDLSLTKGVKALMSEFPASFIPTIAGELRYITNPHLREVYKKEDDWFTLTWNKVVNKLPIAVESLRVRKDVIGRDLNVAGAAPGSSFGIRALGAFATLFSPGIIQESRPDKTLKWLQEFSLKHDTTDVLPKDWRRKNEFTIQGVKYKLSALERDAFLDSFWKRAKVKLYKLRNLVIKRNISKKRTIKAISDIYSDEAKRLRIEIIRKRVK